MNWPCCPRGLGRSSSDSVSEQGRLVLVFGCQESFYDLQAGEGFFLIYSLVWLCGASNLTCHQARYRGI